MAPAGEAADGNPKVIFYFDIVCPYAYIASTRIDDVARFTGADITWRPVLLGGLYELDKAPQGKDGSATDAVPEAKRIILARQFQNDLNRYQVPLKFPPQHPLRSVDAGRLLCAFPEQLRSRLAHALYRAYWVDSSNISNHATLIRIAKSLRIPKGKLGFEIDESIFNDKRWADRLRQNTEEAHNHGAFGVPWFYIPDRDKSYFGQDRLHLVEAELYALRRNTTFDQLKSLERLWPRCLRTPAENRYRQLRFWFDFSSAWSYLAYTQLERIQREAGPALEIVFKPFLLGALFKAVGTPEVPASALSELKQRYAQQDLSDWTEWFNAVNAQEYPPVEGPQTQWPEAFPIRSPVALRVALQDPRTVGHIFRAAWRDNKDISRPDALTSLLTEHGFDGRKLVASASSGGPRYDELSRTLRANTDEAIGLGLCGAPGFQLMGQHRSRIIWGSDRINVVQDMICGWHPEKSRLRATVAAFPAFDYRL